MSGEVEMEDKTKHFRVSTIQLSICLASTLLSHISGRTFLTFGPISDHIRLALAPHISTYGRSIYIKVDY